MAFDFASDWPPAASVDWPPAAAVELAFGWEIEAER
jgi:hypothetical protein